MGPIYSRLAMIPEELSTAMVREAEKEFRRVVGYLYPLRRDRQLTKAEFEKQYRKASEEHFVVLAAEPLLPLRKADPAQRRPPPSVARGWPRDGPAQSDRVPVRRP